MTTYNPWFAAWRYRRARYRRADLQGCGPISMIEPLERRRLLAAHVLSDSTVYATIQAAVDASPAGATITVDPGTYPEQVSIYKMLTLQGAQAGIDARSNVRAANPANASVLTGQLYADGTRSCSFYIAADDVTIDGFTVQDETVQDTSRGAGIAIAPGHSGAHILNTIVQNNVSGLFLANASSTDPAVIQHNLFRNNNHNGDDGGRGIYSDGGISGGNLTNVTIDSNAFYHNVGGWGTTYYESGISLESQTPGSQSNIRITNNQFQENGKAILAWNVNGLLIQGNVITHETDQASGAVRFEGGVSNATITGNTIYDNSGPAMRTDSKTVPADESGFVVNNNNFYHNAYGYGSNAAIMIVAGTYNGTFDLRNNWWGDPSGPGYVAGTGDSLYTGRNSVVYSPWSTSPVGGVESPYWGVPASDGAPIQAEDYDHGGEGIAYHDTDLANIPKQYRPGEGVDIESSGDSGGGYDVTSTVAGEWLQYTLKLSQSGPYRADFRVASAQTIGGALHLEIDGQNVTGSITVPDTGGWQNWQTIWRDGINLPAGPHVARLVFDSNGSDGTVANVNWFQLVQSAGPTTPAGTATFLRSDNTTQGAWSGVYGSDGNWIFGQPASLPGYAQVTPAGQQAWTWASNTTDLRAMQTSANATGRIAATLFSASSFSLDINLTDGKPHQVAIYLLDWDSAKRAETVTVTDPGTGLILDTQANSGFAGGRWLVWDLSGHTLLNFTRTGGLNCVASGILFDAVVHLPAPPPPPPPAPASNASATFLHADAATEGSWVGVYGSDGRWVFGLSASLPGYAQATLAGQQSWTWTSNTSDPRAMQTSATAPARIAATIYSTTSFNIDVNLTDGKPHQIAVYLLDWDSQNRAQSLTLTDAGSGAVLDTRSASGFRNGLWLVWNITGHARINLTRTGGLTSVASGILFDPPGGTSPATSPPPASSASAAFLRSDSVTQGAWRGTYGADGYSIANGSASIPAYAKLSVSGNQSWTWASSTSDVRALQTAAASSNRLAACLFSGSAFTVDLNLTDGKSHQLALYLLDWDTNARAQTITLTDPATGAVLDTRSASSFHNGLWLSWKLTGHVQIRIARSGGLNAVLSGIFFDPAPG